MGSNENQRIAQRHEVATTPIRWKVPVYRRGSSQPKLTDVDGAIVEVSIMGAGIVTPVHYDHLIGTRIELTFQELVGFVMVRRAMPYPGSDRFWLYGVEYAAMQSTLGMAIYERLVVAGQGLAAVDAFDPTYGAPTDTRPGMWSPPISWNG